ncbi:MAG: hypothetical protein ACX94A_08035 [Algiphilus sp.]
MIAGDGALDAATVMGGAAMKGLNARHLVDARKVTSNTGVQALPRSRRGGLAPA